MQRTVREPASKFTSAKENPAIRFPQFTPIWFTEKYFEITCGPILSRAEGERSSDLDFWWPDQSAAGLPQTRRQPPALQNESLVTIAGCPDPTNSVSASRPISTPTQRVISKTLP